MATRQILQNGTTANDGTGDTLRSASDKINQNFRELFLKFGDSVQATSALSFDSDGRVVFDGGSYNTILGANTPSSSNKYVNLPNASGTIVLKDTVDVLSNKTLTDPIVSTFHDSNSVDIISFNGISNASHYLEVRNGDSVDGVNLCVHGDSANIDLCLTPKNSGAIKLNGQIAPEWEQLTENGTASVTKPVTFLNRSSGTPFNVVLPDGLNVGEEKKFVSLNTTTATITPNNFAHNSGNSDITVATYSSVTFIWTGTNWHILSTSDTGVAIV
jgi:hypothetical protein